MSLVRSTRALARLAAACSRLGGPHGAGLGLSAPSAAPLQQLVSLAAYTPAQGFAAAAAAAPPPPPAAAAAATSAAEAPPSAAAGAAAAAAEPQHPPVYERLPGRIDGHYSVPPKRVFAVVEVGGTQVKVTPNDVVVVEKLGDVDVNDTLRLNRVLLLGSAAETVIGRPYVPGAAVTAAVEEQFLDGKVLIFHKRRRKNSRRLRGHRQPLTTLRILDVQGIEEGEAPAALAEAAAVAAAVGQ